ncbi:hypothetical protein MVES_000550 [Malassezia vespertilionis]|uniref:RRM domain-containing protein n=1 Tax=Malassezia vespertilionis TaxID=2020962 RepID=A0A2N1JHM2_9BASI|nr:hypothetical protein MVES_000550 [Malassezia vespertilionis]
MVGKSQTIYIGGLDKHATVDELYQAFITFGDIHDIQIPKVMEGSDESRGFGFITFSNEEEAEDAIDNMHLNELRGNVLSVNAAKPQKMQLADTRRAIWETDEWREQYGEANEANGETVTA